MLKRENTHRKISLNRSIFLYLLGMAILSLILPNFMWVERKLTEYRNDIDSLKRTFSETRKAEIKNKILQVKDFIYWSRNNPNHAIAKTLTWQVEKLKLPPTGSGTRPEKLPQWFKDSVNIVQVPVYIINTFGKIVYSYNPYTKAENKQLNEEERTILFRVNKSNQIAKGTKLLYKSVEQNDSVLNAAAYYDNMLMPGFTVAYVISSEYFENVLQEYILDTLSKLRYTEDEYIFVNSYNGQPLITAGKPDITPVNTFASDDNECIDLFKVQQSSVVHAEGVFHTYMWPKISSTKTPLKTSFFSSVPEWKWIIGTGFYADDVISIIESKRKVLYSDLKKILLYTTVFFLISCLLSYLIARFFAKRLGRNINLFRNFFENAAKENVSIDLSQVNYHEFSKIAEAANFMVEEVLALEKRFRETLENVHLITVLLDLNGNITFCNNYLLNHTGYKSDEVIGNNWFKMFVPETRPDVKQFFLNGLHEGKIIPFYENPIRTKNGEERIVRFSNTLLRDPKGNVIGATSIGEDITERKQAEILIQKLNLELESRVKERTSQLESVNKELESYSYSISHDLGAPLRAIYGFSQILASRHRTSLNDEGKQYMDYIVEACIRMEHLIDDLLNYSRLGRKSIKLRPIPVNNIINKVSADFKSQLKEIGAKIILKNELPVIPGNESLLGQVFSNLFSNAINYRRSDESLEVSISSEKIANDQILKITDNGIGIPKEYWEKIFNVFQRLHNEDKYSGTGIGLATVKKAVTLLGGTIWVESVVNKGTTFFIKVPDHQF